MLRDTIVSRLLTHLGQSVGLDALACDADGVCHLLIDGRHLVQFVEHTHDHLLMSCALSAQASETQDPGRLLRANFGQTAGGIVFAQAPDSKLCAQVYVPCADVHVDTLFEHLETLILEVERWEAHLTQPELNRTQDHPPSLLVQTV